METKALPKICRAFFCAGNCGGWNAVCFVGFAFALALSVVNVLFKKGKLGAK